MSSSTPAPSPRAGAELSEDVETGHRSIALHGWTVTSTKRPILNSVELERAAERIPQVPMPEICFGNNALVLRHAPSGFVYTFDALDALATVDPTGERAPKVAYAEAWAKSRELEAGATGDGSLASVRTVKRYDWTYTTDHPGRVGEGSAAFEPARAGESGIPMGRLASQDEPILFFDDVSLFEDELHDNGVAQLSVKVRVMPSCWFALQRFFLRVDHVLFRLYDVRIFHDFASDRIVRECRGREAPYEQVRARLPVDKQDDLTPLSDPNWVASILGLLETTQLHAPSPPAPSPSSIRSYVASSAAPPRVIAPGIELPNRTPSAMPRSPATPPASTPAPASTAWPGLGTRLEIARLPLSSITRVQ